jgi:cell division protein FtsB
VTPRNTPVERSTASAPGIKRLIVVAIAVAVAVFAVQGGEYGTFDLLRQRSRRTALRARVDTLRHQVDSLTRLAHAIQSDPAMQERIAREEFGMVRGSKELLYRFAPTPTAGPHSPTADGAAAHGTALGAAQPVGR